MDLFIDVADRVAVHKVLEGVKDRAEGRVESFTRSTLKFAIIMRRRLSPNQVHPECEIQA